MTLSPLELLEKLAALVPLPRVHLVRYGGCLAPHSSLRGALTPTPRQQGVDGHEANTGTPRWSWARLLGRVCDLDMATCPWCRHGALRIIAALTQASVITRILRHLTLASVPPPIAPARSRQATFDWVASAHDVARGLVSAVRTVEVCFTPLSVCNPVCIYPLRSRPSRGLRPSTPDGPTLSHPALHVQAAQHRAPPGSGAHRRGCRAALGAREEPRRGVAAGGGRWEVRSRGGGAKRPPSGVQSTRRVSYTSRRMRTCAARCKGKRNTHRMNLASSSLASTARRRR